MFTLQQINSQPLILSVSGLLKILILWWLSWHLYTWNIWNTGSCPVPGKAICPFSPVLFLIQRHCYAILYKWKCQELWLFACKPCALPWTIWWYSFPITVKINISDQGCIHMTFYSGISGDWAVLFLHSCMQSTSIAHFLQLKSAYWKTISFWK